jgi:hypothetical protein
MSENWKKINFKIPKQDIRKDITWQLSHEDSSAREVAKPLFDTGVYSVAMVHKRKYPKRSFQEAGKSSFHATDSGGIKPSSG